MLPKTQRTRVLLKKTFLDKIQTSCNVNISKSNNFNSFWVGIFNSQNQSSLNSISELVRVYNDQTQVRFFYILMFIYDFILMIFAFEGGRCEDSTEKWKRRRWHRGVSETFSNAIFHLHLRNKSNQFDQYQSEIINYRPCSEIGLILLWYLQ